jgi:hypothetical protein
VLAAIKGANVRLTYAADRRPLMWAVVAGGLVALFLWLVTGHPVYAVAYSAGFAIVWTLVRRSKRGKQRFARWAAQHPMPRA